MEKPPAKSSKRRMPNGRTWKDRDVRRVGKLARELGIDPAVLEVDTTRGIVRVSGRGGVQAGNPWDVEVEKLTKRSSNKSSSNK